MQQLTQQLKDGDMKITEVPWPSLGAGMVLIRNHYSLISAGTEGSTVKAARKSMLGKAKERPQQVKQVVDVLKSQGAIQTYRAVMKKLEALSPLGYSCVGEVIDVAPGVTEFKQGDFVACGGMTASHAEVVSVPKNLCVKVDTSASADVNKHLAMAAYNTLGAIAMQGVRQADLRLGESCVVIGLGLLGQLTCLLLKASGVRVFGVDIDLAAVEMAKHNCADLAMVQGDASLIASIDNFTDGAGCDSVIIAAATDSLQPINFAGEILRKRGVVVILGAVPTGFDRDPHFYRKELELRMSCSYGPGRYDIDYEDKGIDYPLAYVRWTEKRNMFAFQELIKSSKIDLSYLTTHEFSLENAPAAYDMILKKSEPFSGILIRYDTEKVLKQESISISPDFVTGRVGIAFIGAGNYAQGNLLPNLPKDRDVVNKAVMTASGTTSRRVAELYNFEACTSDKADIFSNDSINTVFISTRHDTHGQYVLDALEAGKHIFVEKPLCILEEDLIAIENIYRANAQGKHVPHLMVGFNRRFSPLSSRLTEIIGKVPMSMVYRVNAGAIPADSWIQDGEIGGGRIIGEVCHFIDYMVFLCGSMPKRLFASTLPDSKGLNDTVTINLEFANGSIGSIIYLANGNKTLPKEYIEVHTSGMSAVLNDYRELNIYISGKPKKMKLSSQNKGQKIMVESFINSLKGGSPLIPIDEVFAVTRATIKVLESVKTHQALSLD